MRFSHFFLSFAVIFFIQFGPTLSQQQQQLVGTWSNPIIDNNYGSSCCIPDSITIGQKDTSKWFAKYNYAGVGQANRNSDCSSLFALSSAQLTLSYSYSSGGYDATLDPYIGSAKTMFTYKLVGSTLNIQFHKDYSSPSYCNFTMSTYSSNAIPPAVAIGVLLAILGIVIFIVYKKRQGAQIKEINERKATLKDEKDPLTVRTNSAALNPNYVAPSTGYTVPSAGYVVPNTGYTVPNTGYTVPPTGYVVPTMAYNQPYPQMYVIPQANVQVQPQPQVNIQPQPKAQVQPKPVIGAQITTTINAAPRTYQF